MPEAGMPVRSYLALVCKTSNRIEFPHRFVAIDIVKYRRFTDEKAAADPSAVAGRLFPEGLNRVVALVK